MKKIFFAILCASAVISCAKEVVITADQEAITFESAFVDKATKAAYDGSYNNTNFNEFQVYATITGAGTGEGTANIFNGERVVKGATLGQGVNWSYATANTQYWIPGNNYQFRAVADGHVETVTEVVTDTYGMATAINLLDASAQKDILTAQYNVTNYTKPQNGTPDPVAFTFAHVLSKAKFTVKNTIDTNNAPKWAHPYQYGDNMDKVLEGIKQYVDGVECYHHTTREEGKSEYLKSFCKKNGLMISGGSDFHIYDSNGADLLNGLNIPAEYFDEIKNRLGNVSKTIK